ncbi:hypothetical protein DN068_17080 [Taibaiella soli]|uniref:Uncharacterized protein n=1 Tax=Taibaiella soli TaxID=1649169 RepID=A0A2W2AVT2_9BACT|nr:hypothetical protein DN068_17080 [Taibaiella soli]
MKTIHIYFEHLTIHLQTVNLSKAILTECISNKFYVFFYHEFGQKLKRESEAAIKKMGKTEVYIMLIGVLPLTSATQLRPNRSGIAGGH